VAKSELRYLNRAFRKHFKKETGQPYAFTSKRQLKEWCRSYAVLLSCHRFFSGEYITTPITSQVDADAAVAEDISHWG
jgi:hypothetical protein